MFRSWYRNLVTRRSQRAPRGPRPRTRLQVESLEDRQLLAGNGLGIPSMARPGFAVGNVHPLPAATEGQAGTTTLSASFVDANPGIGASDLTATVDYGDGTPLATAIIGSLGGGQ